MRNKKECGKESRMEDEMTEKQRQERWTWREINERQVRKEKRKWKYDKREIRKNRMIQK